MRRSVARAMVLGLSATTLAGPAGMTVYATELETDTASSELNIDATANADEQVDNNVDTDNQTEESNDDVVSEGTVIQTSEEEMQSSQEEADDAKTIADSAVETAENETDTMSSAANLAEEAADDALDAVENTTQNEAQEIIAEAEETIEAAEQSFDDAKTEYDNALAAYEQAKADYETAVLNYETAKSNAQAELSSEIEEQGQALVEKQAEIEQLEEEISTIESELTQAGANAILTAEENGTSDVQGYLSAIIEYYYLPKTVSLEEGQIISDVTVSQKDDNGDPYVVVTYNITSADGSVESYSVDLGYGVEGDSVSLYERETKYEYTDDTGSYSKTEAEMESMVEEGTAVVRYLYNGTYYTADGLAALGLSDEEIKNVSSTYVVLGYWSEATVDGKGETTYTSYTLNGTTKQAVASKEVADYSKDSTTITYFDADGNYVQVVTNYTTQYVYKYVNGEQISKTGLKDLDTAKADINDTLEQLNNENDIYDYYWIVHYYPGDHNYRAWYYLDYVYRETTTTEDSYTETSVNDSSDADEIMRNSTAIFNNHDGEYTSYIAKLKQMLADYQSKKEQLSEAKADVETIESTIDTLKNKYSSMSDLTAASIANITYWETRLAEAQQKYQDASKQLQTAKETLAKAKSLYEEKYSVSSDVDSSESASSEGTSSEVYYELVMLEDELDEEIEEEELDEDELDEVLQQIFNDSSSSHSTGGTDTSETAEDTTEPEEQPEEIVEIEEEEVPLGITAAGLLKRAWWGVFIAAPAAGGVGVVLLEGKRRAAEIAAELIDK